MMPIAAAVFAAASPVLYLVIGLSVAIAVFGLWLMLGQGGQSGDIQMRLSGVKLIKRYEMGDSLASARELPAPHLAGFIHLPAGLSPMADRDDECLLSWEEALTGGLEIIAACLEAERDA